MSTDNPTPAPEATRWQRAWQKARPWVIRVLLALIPVVALATREGCPKLVPVVEYIEVLVPQFAEKPADADYVPTHGWVRDPNVIAGNLDPAVTPQFADTPAGRAVLGDDDVFLWQAVRKVNNRGPPWYPNVNQGSVGCCVGAGFKHGCDVVQATAILSGKAFEWKPVSVEVIYGGSRVECGGGRISGDGSIGAWAAAWVKNYGVVPMEEFRQITDQGFSHVDLRTFSPAKARDWGRRGVPDALEAVAKEYPVKGTALVKSWADVKRAVAQGYPVAVCSDQGFSMQRDATGRARPQGSWAHCMCVIGVRAAKDGRTEGGFILNSWGDSAHTGPVWPADAPVAGFWADAAVIDRMVRQGDSFALADVAGFPGRPLPPDWFINARPARPAFPRLSEFEFALAY